MSNNLIKRAEFVTSLTGSGAYPGQGRPEVIIAGRSNVGKSTFINRICGRKALARVSSEPGKTRLVNIYEINGGDGFFFVDLPGYGYARIAREKQAAWGPMIEGFIKNSAFICHALLLVDIRHEPTGNDAAMAGFLRDCGISFTVIANKCDKISKAARGRAVMVVGRTLGIQPWDIIPFSGVDGTGREAVDDLLARVTAEVPSVDAAVDDDFEAEGMDALDGDTHSE